MTLTAEESRKLNEALDIFKSKFDEADEVKVEVVSSDSKEYVDFVIMYADGEEENVAVPVEMLKEDVKTIADAIC